MCRATVIDFHEGQEEEISAEEISEEEISEEQISEAVAGDEVGLCLTCLPNQSATGRRVCEASSWQRIHCRPSSVGLENRHGARSRRRVGTD